MATLVRWEPFNDMISLRDAMDQLFENALIGFGPSGATRQTGSGFAFPVDVTENDNAYVVKASLPGIKPEDLNVTVQDNVLTIEGETKAESEDNDKEQRYHVRERRWGTFARSITLPMSIDANQVQADYEHGVLTMTLPKSQEAKPKRISVRGMQGQKTIEGKSTTVGTNK